jgi:hypothetical protein
MHLYWPRRVARSCTALVLKKALQRQSSCHVIRLSISREEDDEAAPIRAANAVAVHGAVDSLAADPDIAKTGAMLPGELRVEVVVQSVVFEAMRVHRSSTKRRTPGSSAVLVRAWSDAFVVPPLSAIPFVFAQVTASR